MSSLVSDVRRLPVITADGTLVGVVSRVDLLGVYDRPDSEIQTEMLERVIDDEFVLDGPAFNVKVAAGVATISGVVSSGPVAINLLDAIRQGGRSGRRPRPPQLPAT